MLMTPKLQDSVTCDILMQEPHGLVPMFTHLTSCEHHNAIGMCKCGLQSYVLSVA